MTVWKIFAIVLGVLGVVVIVRPETGAVNPGQLIALAAAVGFGISVAMMKSLTRTEQTLSIIFWMLVIQSAAGFFPSLYLWRCPSAYAWGWIVVIAFCGTFSHYCMARAMLYADATVVLPMDFLRVPLTATAGWLIYSERLDAFTYDVSLSILRPLLESEGDVRMHVHRVQDQLRGHALVPDGRHDRSRVPVPDSWHGVESVREQPGAAVESGLSQLLVGFRVPHRHDYARFRQCRGGIERA